MLTKWTVWAANGKDKSTKWYLENSWERIDRFTQSSILVLVRMPNRILKHMPLNCWYMEKLLFSTTNSFEFELLVKIYVLMLLKPKNLFFMWCLHVWISVSVDVYRFGTSMKCCIFWMIFNLTVILFNPFFCFKKLCFKGCYPSKTSKKN